MYSGHWVPVQGQLQHSVSKADYCFIQSLSNFIWIQCDKWGNNRVTGQRSWSTLALCLWNVLAKYSLQFLMTENHFQTSHVGCLLERRIPIGLGSDIKTNFETLLENYRIVFAKPLSNFTCKLLMMKEGTLKVLGHRVKINFGHCLWNSVGKMQSTVCCPITFN